MQRTIYQNLQYWNKLDCSGHNSNNKFAFPPTDQKIDSDQ